MNAKLFYDLLRNSNMLGPVLSASEFQGVNAIVNYALSRNLNAAKIAYILATTYHETAGTMQPIRERGGVGYFTRLYDVTGKNPKRARSMGNTQPGDGARYYGRGFVQLTWKKNYAKAGAKLGLDLVKFPDEALKLDVATKILVEGMIEGWFTGKSLAMLPSDCYAIESQFRDARVIINGHDDDDLIAEYAEAFQEYLKEAGVK